MEEMEDFDDLSGTIDGNIDGEKFKTGETSNFLYDHIWGIATKFQNHASIKSNQRPWIEFVMPSRFQKPTGMSVAVKRGQRNLRYFWANYLIFALGFSCLWLLTKPLTLVILLCIAYFYFYIKDIPIQCIGKQFPPHYQNHIVNCITCLLVVYFIGPAALSSFSVAGILAVTHAVFYDRIDTFADSTEEEELWNTVDPDEEFPGV